MKEYVTVEKTATGTVTDRKSEFIGYVTHAESEREALEFLTYVRKKDHDARHHCYAYVLRDGAVERQSDDGEPQKTAGMPILEVIRHQRLEDVIIVVTRYFGGTLLGTGGLVRAYTRAAQACLENAEIVHYRSCRDLELEVDYSLYDRLNNLLTSREAKVVSTDFAERIRLVIRTPEECREELAGRLTTLTKGMRPAVGEEIFDVF